MKFTKILITRNRCHSIVDSVFWEIIIHLYNRKGDICNRNKIVNKNDSIAVKVNLEYWLRPLQKRETQVKQELIWPGTQRQFRK